MRPCRPPADRADVLLEKGRILEDRLGRDEDALVAYRAALAVAPGHPGALLALMLLAVSTRDVTAIDEALAGLAAHVEDPKLRALFVVERARQQRGSINADGLVDRIRLAADTLFHALSSPVDEDPICEELDRLSLLADDGDLRARVLDAFDARFGHEDTSRHDPALLVAVHREKARLLCQRGARDGALAVLERGLRLLPRHPLLVSDLLALADEAGRPDAIAALEQAGHLEPGEATDEAVLRRAEAAARTGAYGEAMGILGGLPADGPMAALAALLRVRVLARTGDLEGLAEAFASQADALARTDDVDGAGGTGAGVDGAGAARVDQASRREAAHLLVRAAVIRGELLKDAATAKGLLARALELAPDFAPAREAQRASAIDRKDAPALAALYEAEAGGESDPERREALLRSAYLIQRDLNRDNDAVARLLVHAPNDSALTTAVRNLDQTGEAAVASAAVADEAGTVVPALLQLLDSAGGANDLRVGDVRGSAGLWLLGARLAGAAGRADEAQELAARAFAIDPTCGAAALLEAQHTRAGRLSEASEVVAGELRQAGAGGSQDTRALRFRLALTAVEAGRWQTALDALAPLRLERDRAAVVWSFELARRSADPALEAALLREPAVADLLAGNGDDNGDAGEAGASSAGAVLIRLALADAQLAQGEVAAALTTVAEGAPVAPGVAPVLAAELALAKFRLLVRAGDGDAAALVAGFSGLADALAGSAIGGDLRQDAALLAVASGLSAADGPREKPTAGSPMSALHAFIAGVRQQDGSLELAGLEALALVSSQPSAPAMLAEVGLRRWMQGDDRATATFALAQARGSTPVAELAMTDLAATGDGRSELPPALLALGHTRAERLASAGGASAAVAAALYAESAARDEAAGRLVGAATGYARMLDLEPSSLEAVLGLERVARRSGDRRGQAAALLRLGSLLREPKSAAAQVGRAARLFEEEGLTEDAGAAYTHVLRLLPRDDDAYQRLHDLISLRDDPAALERLISFKLAQSDDQAERISLYAQRAALRLGPLDRRAEGIADHRRIVALDPGRVESLRTLAELATQAGCPEIAARFLVQALAHTPAGAVDAGPAAVDPHRAATVEFPVADVDLGSDLAAGATPGITTAPTDRPAGEPPGENLGDNLGIDITFSGDGPKPVADLRHRLRLDLAAAYVAGEDEDSAIEILREAVAERPGDKESRERLIDLGMGLRKYDLVAEQFRALSSGAAAAQDQAAWIVRLGRLERDQRRDVGQALAAFREALRLNPLGEAAREFSVTLGEVPMSPEDGPLVSQAVGALRAAIKRNPLSPRRLESLSALARVGGFIDLAEIAAQLHDLLGGPPSRGRTRGLVRSLSVEAFAPALQDDRIRRAAELWPLLTAPLARLCGFDPASMGTNRATRLAPGSEPRLAWADAASLGLGLSAVTIHIAGVDDLGVAAFDAPESCLVLGRGIPAGDARVRFKVGRALTLLAQHAALCDQLTLEELEREWAAAIVLLTDRADTRFDAGALRSRAKALGKEMTRKERKLLDQSAADLGPSSIDVPGWRARILQTANRGGLLVSGDLGMALRAVTKQASPSPADLESEECQDVIHFAFGERWEALREEVRQRDRINTGEHFGGQGARTGKS